MALVVSVFRVRAMNRTYAPLVLTAPPKAVHVTVTNDAVMVDLADGRTISVPIGWFPRLVCGTAEERANVQIAGAGFGLYWPDLDEDVGVEGLLLGKRPSEVPASFARWLEQRDTQHHS